MPSTDLQKENSHMQCQATVTQEINLLFCHSGILPRNIFYSLPPNIQPKTLRQYPDPTELLLPNNQPLNPGPHYFMTSLFWISCHHLQRTCHLAYLICSEEKIVLNVLEEMLKTRFFGLIYTALQCSHLEAELGRGTEKPSKEGLSKTKLEIQNWTFFFFPLIQHSHYRNDETSTQGVLGEAFIFRKQSYVAVSSITEPISCSHLQNSSWQ